MHQITLTTSIAAPPERCFDLARDIDAHVRSARQTGERAVAGRTTGLIGPGEEVTWEARHFFVWQRLTSRITAFDRPRFFQDTMQRGAFASFQHDHIFEACDEGTRMIDILRFAAPLWPLSLLVERVLLGPYLRRFLRQRANALREMAEAERANKTSHQSSD